MAKQLKCWQGIGFVPQLGEKEAWIYVAAYSISDIATVCAEVGLFPPSYNEVKKYWYGTWGNNMNGIPIERGVWASKLYQNTAPIKLESK